MSTFPLPVEVTFPIFTVCRGPAFLSDKMSKKNSTLFSNEDTFKRIKRHIWLRNSILEFFFKQFNDSYNVIVQFRNLKLHGIKGQFLNQSMERGSLVYAKAELRRTLKTTVATQLNTHSMTGRFSTEGLKNYL
jgi:hypothetical protein